MFYLLIPQETLQTHLKRLENDVVERSNELERAKLLHEYVKESDDIGEWIEAHYQIASSEDFGEDYEHQEVNHNYSFSTLQRIVSFPNIER